MNIFVEIREGVGISWGALRANKMRSVLATLGIIIGIVSVTLMGTALEGLNTAFMKSISAIGADVFFVSRQSWFNQSYDDWYTMQKRRPIRFSETKELPSQLTLAAAVAPTAEFNATVSYKDRSADLVWITGTTADYIQTAGVGVMEGRFLSEPEADGGRPVCVIGAEVVTNLFRNTSPIGEHLKVNGQAFEVIGILEKQGKFLGTFSLDNRVVIPLRQAMANFYRDPDLSIRVKANALAQIDEAREDLRMAMRRVRHLAPQDPDDFSINQQDQFVKQFNEVSGTIAIIGFFITSLSLFVGGIGIMNIMFVSVAERTREIGVRKAIGARRRTILLQFLAEAASICLGGGLIGLAIAWTLILIVGNFLPLTLSLRVVSVALIVAFCTGVVSGFLPAWRAARMNPVDALRSE
ncbi:MAG TPA: ABC transporter permease [Verrucomicrobiae bacterium]|jgi:putative ABC transport system permease protein|nr:ABC transporter permease [Verrucomicrobiae bacterium]